VKSNIKRRHEIYKDVLPPVGTKAYFDLNEKIEQDNTGFKDFSKKSWVKVTNSLEAQFLSNCDFLTEMSLRHFLKEFNHRAWEYGLRSMPLMFNIMEAFFIYRKPEIYFELIEEENYLISFFDFIDFITSKEFEENKTLIEESITSDIIYNFNVGKDLEEIKFKSDNDEEYIIAGVSIIRRGNEITVLMIAGKKKALNVPVIVSSSKLDTENPNKSEMLDDFKETLKNQEIEYEYLDDDKKYIKVLVASRIDLETMTIDARYVAEETNLMFNILTDDIDGFLGQKDDFFSEESKKAYKYSREKMDAYNPIFEVIKLSLYLPYFFNSNEDVIIEEVLDTNFKKQYSSPINKRKFNNVFGYKDSKKSLYSLDTNNIFSPDKIKLRDDLFKVQTSGYWKKLGLDEIGLGKKGNHIHGRTWVNQNLSWFEVKEQDLIIEKDIELFKGANAGFIYILRNPVMSKNVYKIGLTKNNVEDRANQLSKTSVPDKFHKCQEWNVKDCDRAEKEIFLRLDKFRIDPRREFFQIDLDKAIKVIKEVIDEINND
jgi:hypothetical protein